MSSVLQKQRSILKALFDATGGYAWSNKAGWNTDASLENWFGVSLENDFVVKIDLTNNGVRGSIPPKLGGLEKLERLNLSSNDLTGSIPSELGRLQNLALLNLELNNLSGNIPPELGSLKNLTGLRLCSNKLTGIIPSELGNLAELRDLRLWGNHLEGSIPPELGSLEKLESLILNFNKLTGSIPPQLGKLSNLQELLLNGNNLEGSIPRQLGQLSNLRELSLHGNSLEGSIPRELGGLQNLEVLFLNKNKLTELPEDVAVGLQGLGLKFLQLEGNPWASPPAQVVELGLREVATWWYDKRLGGTNISRTLKLALVGNQGVGKSSVLRTLETNEPTCLPSQDQTIGVHISKPFKIEGQRALEVTVWDFAGQADYYDFHQVFLTEGALYVLVISASGNGSFISEQHERLHRWLDALWLRAPGSHVSLLATHSDDCREEDLEGLENKLEECVEAYLKEKAKQDRALKSSGAQPAPSSGERPSGGEAPKLTIHVERVQVVSCKDGSGFEGLRTHIYDTARAAGRVGIEVPNDWLRAMAVMDALADGTNLYKAFDGDTGAQAPNQDDVSSTGLKKRPFFLWEDAVKEWRTVFVERRGEEQGARAEEVLLQAAKLAEVEGRALFSCGTKLLHIDVTYVVELLKRVSDHRLVDPQKKAWVESALEAFAVSKRSEWSSQGLEDTEELHTNDLIVALEDFKTGGRLTSLLLEFLWGNQLVDEDGELQRLAPMSDEEMERMVKTMLEHDTMFRAPQADGGVEAPFIVPMRLPVYGFMEKELLQFRSEKDIPEGQFVFTREVTLPMVPPGFFGRMLARWSKRITVFHMGLRNASCFVYDGTNVLAFRDYDSEAENQRVRYVLLGKGTSQEKIRQVLTEMCASVVRLIVEEYKGLQDSYRLPNEEGRPLEGGELQTKMIGMYRLLDIKLDEIKDKMAELTQMMCNVTKELRAALGEDLPVPNLISIVVDEEVVGGRDSSDNGGDGTHGPNVPRHLFMFLKKGLAEMRAGLERFSRSPIHRKCLVRFHCAYDFSIVECGPDGRGYPCKDPKKWVKDCLPLIQLTLWAAKVAARVVLSMDLPTDELETGFREFAGIPKGGLLDSVGDAMAEEQGGVPDLSELLDKVSVKELSTESLSVPLFSDADRDKMREVSGDAYKALIKFVSECHTRSTSKPPFWARLKCCSLGGGDVASAEEDWGDFRKTMTLAPGTSSRKDAWVKNENLEEWEAVP